MIAAARSIARHRPSFQDFCGFDFMPDGEMIEALISLRSIRGQRKLIISRSLRAWICLTALMNSLSGETIDQFAVGRTSWRSSVVSSRMAAQSKE